jgi:hypothetical protein
VVRITALDLRAVLRACKLARATSVAVPPISYQRWELSGAHLIYADLHAQQHAMHAF